MLPSSVITIRWSVHLKTLKGKFMPSAGEVIAGGLRLQTDVNTSTDQQLGTFTFSLDDIPHSVCEMTTAILRASAQLYTPKEDGISPILVATNSSDSSDQHFATILLSPITMCGHTVYAVRPYGPREYIHFYQGW